MTDVFSKKKRSDIMSAIKGKGTKLEEIGFALLREAGIRFHRHPQGIYGKPDAAHKGKKIAIFFDSDFWHGYDWQNRKNDIKSNRSFWIPKIERNIARDTDVSKRLKARGMDCREDMGTSDVFSASYTHAEETEKDAQSESFL